MLPSLALMVCAASASVGQSRTPLVQSIDLHVPVPPTPITIAGRRHLAYELHVTNFRPFAVALGRIEVRDADRKLALADLRDAALVDRIGRPGAIPASADKRVVAGGMRAVVYLWLPVDDSVQTPTRITHRVELDLVREQGRTPVAVEGGGVMVRKEPPVVLDAPLRGGPWVALYDPVLARGHRASIYTIDGRARIPARYAIDFVRLDSTAAPARGDQNRISNWLGYGAEVLAVADARVAQARDDSPEGETLEAARGSMPLQSASGNHVTLDLGNGRFVFYEHLRHGSIRVKTGDRVRRGQVIGQLGNSGSSSSGPHLHFHVADANATLAAEGLPWVFRRFEVVGGFETIQAFSDGSPWKPVPASQGGPRRLELPAPNVVVWFR
jgi:hypothetical protein